MTTLNTLCKANTLSAWIVKITLSVTTMIVTLSNSLCGQIGMYLNEYFR
jgi:hypothetical protein